MTYLTVSDVRNIYSAHDLGVTDEDAQFDADQANFTASNYGDAVYLVNCYAQQLRAELVGDMNEAAANTQW